MGGGGGSNLFSKKDTKQRTDVRIPDFLKPFLEGAAGTADFSLDNLSGLIGPGADTLAPFDPAETAALDLAEDRALNGPFISTAQDTFLDVAQNDDNLSFLDPTARDALTGSAGGTDLSSFIPPEALERLQASASGEGVDQETLRQIAAETGIPAQTLETLTNTARGDFLFGGEGFDAAVDAAVRAARPQIQSIFGAAGAGGATGGLAQHAVGQSAIDAFASQFGAERRNQLDAAGRLGDLSLTDRGQTADIIAQLEAFGLDASGELAGLAETERGRGLTSASILGEFSNLGADRQLDAASQLPALGVEDVNLLSSVGAARRGQAQAEIDSPIDNAMRLLSAALGGLNPASLLGSQSQGSEDVKIKEFHGGGGSSK